MKVLDFPLIKITGVFVLGLTCAHYAKLPFLLVLNGLLFGLFSLLIVFIFVKKQTSSCIQSCNRRRSSTLPGLAPDNYQEPYVFGRQFSGNQPHGS